MRKARNKQRWGLVLTAALAAGCVGQEPTVPMFAECAPPLLQCGDSCIDTSIDSLHCGDCTTECDVRNGESCVDGSCTLECASGTVACGDRCVDTETDAAHCGDCQTACDTTRGEVCAGGSCTLACGGGSTDCDGECVSTTNDPSHCGDCDTACGAGQVCSSGRCGLGCTGGSSLCGGRCVDFSSDPAHCGDCKTACDTSSGETCSAGACTTPCAGGTTRCGDACVDTNIDPNHCGACDVSCGDDATCGSGRCNCDDGFEGDGRTCTDIDECAGDNDCSPSGECINTTGGYACRCRDSQTGDGRTCTGLELVSVASSGTASNGVTGALALSADARYVAFFSTGEDLVSPPLDAMPSQAYLRDMITHTTSLVSVNDAGAVADAGMAYGLALSLDGSQVGFGTNADNLDGGNDGQINVFVRDLARTSTVLRSGLAPSGGTKADSDELALSGDGTTVAFQSGVTLTGTKVSAPVIYLSAKPGKFVLASVSDAGAVPKVDATCGSETLARAELPSLSADGTRVVFDTPGIGLTSDDDTNCTNDVFLRDLSDPAKPSTTLVSATPAGQACTSEAFEAGSLDAVLSADGSFVAFDSTCTDLVAMEVDSGQSEVFLRDLARGTTTKVSVSSSGGQANGPSYTPQISADGRYVAFASDATNLVAGDTNGRTDVFVRDMQTKKTTRVDLDADGKQLANGASGFAFASSGAALAFSPNQPLLPEDTTSSGQIYLRYLR